RTRSRAAGLPGRGRGAVRILHPGTDRGRPRPARTPTAAGGSGDSRGPGRKPVPLYRIREDPRRGPARRAAPDRPGRCGMNAPAAPILLENAWIAPVVGTEIESGWLSVAQGRITGIAPGPAPRITGAHRIDATGCLVTPGLVNTHHHLYQWATQG